LENIYGVVYIDIANIRNDSLDNIGGLIGNAYDTSIINADISVLIDIISYSGDVYEIGGMIGGSYETSVIDSEIGIVMILEGECDCFVGDVGGVVGETEESEIIGNTVVGYITII